MTICHPTCHSIRSWPVSVYSAGSWQQPALRGQGFRVVHVHDQNRVLAFHRWVDGEGHDVIVVVHLSTFNRFGYRIGFPSEGEWREAFRWKLDNKHNRYVSIVLSSAIKKWRIVTTAFAPERYNKSVRQRVDR